MRSLQSAQLDFSKTSDGLLPAIVQNQQSLKVLMLGYVNKEAVEQTLASGKVTFFSRSKNRLWVKGETSGNFLMLNDAFQDCDSDSILFMATPVGPVCHTGTDTCFEIMNNLQDLQDLQVLKKSTQTEESNMLDISDELFSQPKNVLFLNYLENHLKVRAKESVDKSYTARLLSLGINKVAQKVGEEAIEMVIEAKDDNPELFLGEAADLLFHYLLLLQAKNFELNDVIKVLSSRHNKN